MARRIAITAWVALTMVVAGCASAGPSNSPVVPASPAPISTATAAPSSSPEAASATPAGSAPSPGASVALSPSDFTSTVDNPWFPLPPGLKLTYHGTKDGKRAVDVNTVSDRTAVIAGVTCRTVDDRLYLDGVLEEKTTDYYVQDRFGNVWYFGEDTAELDPKGKVLNREGTWHAGIDGAVPGIFMEADPTVGHAFPQEYYAGHAEDHFEVVSLSSDVTVPFGSFSGALQTKEWTPLEPDVLDQKNYVKGIGEVLEVAVKGPVEKLELVNVERR